MYFFQPDGKPETLLLSLIFIVNYYVNVTGRSEGWSTASLPVFNLQTGSLSQGGNLNAGVAILQGSSPYVGRQVSEERRLKQGRTG